MKAKGLAIHIMEVLHIDSSHNTDAMLEVELRPSFHDTHSPILEFTRTFTTRLKLFFKKTTFVDHEKASFNSQ